MRHFSKFIAVLAMSIVFAPAAAFAQGTTSDPYENEGPQIQEQIDQSAPAQGGGGGGETTPAAAVAAAEEEKGGGGELPFTGLDLALVIGAGALLLGLGVGMRRFTRPSGGTA
jgi:hypothetical protein